MGAYMMREMKQTGLASSLASAMIFLDMKKLPEEGMKPFAHMFLNAAYHKPEILLS